MEYTAETQSPSRQSFGSSHKGSFGSFKHARQLLSKPSLRFKITSPSSPAMHGYVEHPSLTLPIGIGDSTWIQSLENSGYLQPGSLSPRSSSIAAPKARPRCESAPQEPISTSTRHIITNHRPSLDSVSSTVSPTSSTSTDQSMKRQTKTPIFRLGHIGKKLSRSSAPMTRRQAADAAGKTRSVDLIADSYNAMLESRDALEYEAMLANMNSQLDEEAVSYQSDQRPEAVYLAFEEPEQPQYSFPERQTLQRPSRPHRLPTSDNGELIGFEEDAIYFKPVSFSPEPSPPSRRQQFDRRSPSPSRPRLTPAERRSSREKCEELLEDEICSTTMLGAPGATAEDSALQLGLMISTYERLRDQVADKESYGGEVLGVKSAFDSWLTALKSVHERLINEAVGRDADDDMGILPSTTYHYR